MAGACTTKAERLVEEKWADLGLGPALISAFGAELLLAISDFRARRGRHRFPGQI